MNRYQMPGDTPSILRTIVDTRQDRLALLQQDYPEAEIIAAAKASTRPVRDFSAALKAPNAQFILECKKASPSKGVIRPDFDPVAIARIYQSYAAAISVLTEPDYFQGDFAYLQAVSNQVRCPVLCKDFIFSRYQVALARYFGADAILLMLSILDDETYRHLAEFADELGLHILTEVSDAEEMKRANQLGASVIGINHRNLRDMSVDLERSKALAPLAPEGALLIAESGIENNQQVRHIASHVDGILVGGSLTAQSDIDFACRQLIYGAHKVCGITSAAQAFAARDSGATFAGFIFAERSSRKVNQEQAQAIRQQVRGLRYVGVLSADDYADADTLIAHAAALAETLDLAAIQIHDLDASAQQTLAALKQRLPARTKLHLAHSVTAASAADFRPDSNVDKYVLDHGKGGSGKTFDWTLIQHYPADQAILAGGLQIKNLPEALQQSCYALDLNSGFERKPGHKDAAKLTQAFNIIRSY